uniref:Uncharacterized protein n=1 Tax=Rhizophora mucronata TaxID=61149 RepID=A0A2P2MHS8_RHIMU
MLFQLSLHINLLVSSSLLRSVCINSNSLQGHDDVICSIRSGTNCGL